MENGIYRIFFLGVLDEVRGSLLLILGALATGKILYAGTRLRSEAGMMEMNHNTYCGPLDLEPETEPKPVTAWIQSWINHSQISLYGVLDGQWMCTP